MQLSKSHLGAVLAGSALLVTLGGVGGAVAGSQLGSADIADDSVRSVDIHDGTIHGADLNNGLAAKLSKAGPKGEAGKDATFGAVYRVANYTNGGGGRATVACGDTDAESKKFTAIAGGAHVEVAAGHTNTEPITSSFPGRMDWSTNSPKPNRLDGWIVNFGDGAAPSAGDGSLQVWALCVPTTSIAVQTTNY
jgi:hypothetical protein